MKLHNLLAIAALALAPAAQALTIDNTAGNLASSLGDAASTTTALIVNGEIDAADLQTICDEMPSLRMLDLSGAKVVAYSGDVLRTSNANADANTLPLFSLAGCKATSITLPSTLSTIDEGALASTSITSITIPASVTSIGLGAFSGSSLTSITLPATVKEIGSHAFAQCKNLATVTWNASVTEVPAATFDGCSALTTVTLPSTIAAIDSAAFKGCTALATLAVPASLKSVGDAAFQGSGLTAFNAADAKNLKSLGAWAFADCVSLTEVVVPDEVSTIGRGVFFEDPALAVFVIPSGVTEIPDLALTGDRALNPDQTWGQSVTTIGDYALKDWDTIKKFYLPGNLAAIGTGAMENWTSIEELYGPNVEPSATGEDVWAGVDQANVKLYVEADLVDAYKAADQWKEFNVQEVSGVNDIKADQKASGITAAFEGTNLEIASVGEPIAQVSVFDTAGRCWTVANPKAQTATMDASKWTLRVYIVTVTLTDGTTATFKLAR
ncbi:MAG: leucine-rich repeat domain-containing protein [Bacteroidales bacterium]|nr:leucine-rich repeat domain-containing protein [Bacteroidales bacterium]MCD8393774.1 leucine-rich repeat domain-containing protein [Bacteroidales bacterium]